MLEASTQRQLPAPQITHRQAEAAFRLAESYHIPTIIFFSSSHGLRRLVALAGLTIYSPASKSLAGPGYLLG